jgi:hypothetical protein
MGRSYGKGRVGKKFMQNLVDKFLGKVQLEDLE